MKLRIQAFGKLVEVINKSPLILELEGSHLSELQTMLLETHPSLKEEIITWAVNQKVVPTDCVLNEMDEIALFPPFAGG